MRQGSPCAELGGRIARLAASDRPACLTSHIWYRAAASNATLETSEVTAYRAERAVITPGKINRAPTIATTGDHRLRRTRAAASTATIAYSGRETAVPRR